MNKIKVRNTLQNNTELSFLGVSFNHCVSEKIINNEIFYIIGSDYEDELGIDVKTGNVYVISAEELIFVNSSLEQFIKCIKEMRNLIDFEEKFEEEKRLQEVDFLRNLFSKIDKECIGENHWWNYIFEQIEDGLL